MQMICQIELDGGVTIHCPWPMTIGNAPGVPHVKVTVIDSIWNGYNHLFVTGKVAFQLSDVRSLRTRSTLNETDEPWKMRFWFDRDEELKDFYKYWLKLENKLRRINHQPLHKQKLR
jgi:hypothetical protein